MIPIGHQPILWHVMNYYSQFGHRDFILCLGYKASAVKEFFLNMKPELFEDCVVSRGGTNVELLSECNYDWRVTLIDTGVWRNIGQRLWFVRDKLKDEEIFLANYSDGLADIDLNAMIEEFKKSNKVGCFVAVRPPLTYHLADIADDGRVRDIRSVQASDIWINGGFFIFRREIFDYMREGEELVVEPFRRLLEADLLMAHKHSGFWRSMDTLRDRQALVDIVEQGNVPWQIDASHRAEQPQPDSEKQRVLSGQDA